MTDHFAAQHPPPRLCAAYGWQWTIPAAMAFCMVLSVLSSTPCEGSELDWLAPLPAEIRPLPPMVPENMAARLYAWDVSAALMGKLPAGKLRPVPELPVDAVLDVGMGARVEVARTHARQARLFVNAEFIQHAPGRSLQSATSIQWHAFDAGAQVGLADKLGVPTKMARLSAFLGEYQWKLAQNASSVRFAGFRIGLGLETRLPQQWILAGWFELDRGIAVAGHGSIPAAGSKILKVQGAPAADWSQIGVGISVRREWARQ